MGGGKFFSWESGSCVLHPVEKVRALATTTNEKIRETDNTVHPYTTIRRELFLAATVRAEASLCADECRKKKNRIDPLWCDSGQLRDCEALTALSLVPTIRSIVLQVAERVFLIRCKPIRFIEALMHSKPFAMY